MNKFIVTTTINPPTEALLKYSKLKGWTVIVAGDLKTNHNLFSNLDNIIYLSPEEQEQKYPKLSKLIGWKCIQRRNLAILEAYNLGADIIGIIDDDNIPYNHGKGGGGLLDNINKVSNDFHEAILSNQKTENLDTWGFSDIEIEYEVF